ncbi:hypothetical protein ACVIWV_001402 [Bradyrhizobium diazoefficiens]|jgi:hypothetical protein|uniref:Uncharacterized protein n=2 Tax=Bradyrhizobium diazoefficiens TaxID=1355477 RepID=A0A837CB05_9BRAD|nr:MULTISPECIES: hypothetical protein [Bradyrhizobium]MBP1063715.1 hypothetical protein [Bradyrhizobium japonicum]APO51673.1 hypothetical protein BD122_15425 [Bradyrhizobium diazoefficiens]AWO92911.1 hypothetical protein DI395_33390 [Bradyrhizobium diazoefficiens]KGJ66497.1 hypothetical protein BJA5080_03117 [Bradyrhizobium diazoefficiens SEMIA 5080]KOY07093.1 hypothetical protein AF336_28895 [Bradyrhizobium diazoefficiens]
MSNSTTMPGHQPRQDGEARLPCHHGEGGAPIRSTEPSGGATTHPRAGRDGRMLDASSPIIRALVEISPLSWWRSMSADAFRAAEYLAVRSALEEVARLIEGAPCGSMRSMARMYAAQRTPEGIELVARVRSKSHKPIAPSLPTHQQG